MQSTQNSASQNGRDSEEKNPVRPGSEADVEGAKTPEQKAREERDKGREKQGR